MFLGLLGQRLQGSKEGIRFLDGLQFRLATEERRAVVHRVCVAKDPVVGAEM